MQRIAFLLCSALYALPVSAASFLDGIADTSSAIIQIDGTGFVTDDSHPNRPGDFFTAEISFRMTMHLQRGEAVIAVESGEVNKKDTDFYFIRRGRIFQADDSGKEIFPGALGDLSTATVAALHPLIVANAMSERRQNVRREKYSALFAWNDELWSVKYDSTSGRLASLTRDGYHDVRGDFTEVVSYDGELAVPFADFPSRIVVHKDRRETARIQFTSAQAVGTIAFPAGDPERERNRVIGSDEINIRQIEPHLYAIDLTSLNTRITIAEFQDYLMVIEGAYNSTNCDLVAEKVRTQFDKPVKYFAFSHLHGQYIGGTRSWVAEGATVLAPPSTRPLVDTIVKASHTFRPDALSRSFRPATIETVESTRRIEDNLNAVEIYNVESQHTDEYFIFYFPAQKVLLTGDLMFYRPGKPFTGRSKKLCETIQQLGLAVERCYVTWPLEGYGTKNTVTREELTEGCGK